MQTVKVKYKGKEYKSITSACVSLGISREIFYQYKRKGMTAEHAIKQVLKNKKRNNCTDHLGNKFKSMVDMAKFYSIPYSTFYDRLKRRKWDLERALTTPDGRKPRGKHANKIQGQKI